MTQLGTVFGKEFSRKLGVTALVNGLTDTAKKVHIIVDIMVGGQAKPQDLPRIEQMTNVRPGIILTGRTFTFRIKRAEIFLVLAALDSKERVELKSDEDAKAYRKKAEGLGVNVCALLTACDFSAGNMADNSAWIARSIELADLLGAGAVRIDSAMKKEKELPFETRVNLFVEGLKGALDKTANSKVTLGIENHGFQGNNLAFLLNVFTQVNSPRLGSTMDVGNFYWRGYPLGEVYGILRLLSPYAKHTHMKNIHYPEDQREVMREAGWKYSEYACPLDEGDIDMAKVVGMLKAAGYKGDICIEDESVAKLKTQEERAAQCKRNVDHLKKVLAEAK